MTIAERNSIGLAYAAKLIDDLKIAIATANEKPEPEDINAVSVMITETALQYQHMVDDLNAATGTEPGSDVWKIPAAFRKHFKSYADYVEWRDQ